MAPLTDLEGVWGKPTSTLDWCEENYVVTPYIAEFWNTVSNVAIIFPPIMTMIYLSFCNVERRFYWACVAFLSVGLGSWCFHMTLLYEMQLLDELPMIWGTCVFVYALYESNSKPSSHNYPLVLFLLFYAVTVTWVYVTYKEPIFHQTAYAILVLSLVFRGVYCIVVNKQEYSGFLFAYSFILYAVGFFLWLVDNGFCTQLRQSRASIPSPADAVLQLHGWWHVLVGLGTHGHIMFSCYLRNRFLKRKTTIWHLGFVPFVSVGTTE